MATAGTKLHPLRVLIADDADDVAAWLGVLLRREGYEVRAVASGAEALAAAAEFHPRVALLDIGMPGLDGYQLAREIRSQPWGKDAVLIATTGWGDAEDRMQAHAAGFNHHLVKPVPPEKLLALLATIQ